MSAGRMALDQVVRTIMAPAAQTGHVGAWALDCDGVDEVKVTVIDCLANAPTRRPLPGEIFVWYGAPVAGGERLEQVAVEQLDGYEWEQARRLRYEADRSCFIAAHAGLRRILGAVLGVRPLAVCFSYGPHGKPQLGAGVQENVYFNISHTRGLIAVAVAGRPIGIDVEMPTPFSGCEDAARSVFAPDALGELAAASSGAARNALFYRFWTLGEAYMKAAGVGLGRGLDGFCFTSEGPPHLTRVAAAYGPMRRWQFGLC